MEFGIANAIKCVLSFCRKRSGDGEDGVYDFDEENFGGAGGDSADDKSKVKSLAAKRSQQVSKQQN